VRSRVGAQRLPAKSEPTGPIRMSGRIPPRALLDAARTARRYMQRLLTEHTAGLGYLLKQSVVDVGSSSTPLTEDSPETASSTRQSSTGRPRPCVPTPHCPR
jgi:hypothetical protein